MYLKKNSIDTGVFKKHKKTKKNPFQNQKQNSKLVRNRQLHPGQVQTQVTHWFVYYCFEALGLALGL